jgi:hypothetical protein
MLGIIDICVASVPIIDFTKQNSIIDMNEWLKTVCISRRSKTEIHTYEGQSVRTARQFDRSVNNRTKSNILYQLEIVKTFLLESPR